MVELYETENLNHHRSRPKFRKRMNQIIKTLEKKPLTTQELKEEIKISRGYLLEHLSYLEFDGKIIKTGKREKTWHVKK